MELELHQILEQMELHQILERHNFSLYKFLENNLSLPQELIEDLKCFYAAKAGGIPPTIPEKQYNQAIQDQLRQDLTR